MRLLVVSILGSVAASLLGLEACRHLHLAAWAHANEVIGNYLQTLGTIYAVLLAFIVFVVWNQHNEARSFTEREANDLRDLHRVARCVSPAMEQHIRAYTDTVIQEEWDSLAQGRESTRAQQLLEQIWAALQAFQPQSCREEALYESALTRFDDLSDSRADRVRASRVRLPSILWLLLVSGATTLVASLWLMEVKEATLHRLITGAMAGAISHILYLIWDLDSCFSGDWRVRSDPFECARACMD